MRHAHPIVIQPVLHWSHDASELFSLCCLPLQLCFSSSLPTSPPTFPPAQPLPEVSASPDFVPLCCWHAAPEAGRRSKTRLRIYLAQPPHLVIEPPPRQSQCEKQPTTPATPISSPAAGMPANLAKQVAAAFPLRANHNPASASTQQTTAKTRLLACAFAFAQDFTHRRAMGLGGFRPKALH